MPGRRPRGPLRDRRLLAGPLAALVLTGGCTAAPGEDDGLPEEARTTAEALAAGLERGELAGVPLSRPVGPAALTRLLGTMAEIPVTVEVAGVEAAGAEGGAEGGAGGSDGALARLAWTWELERGRWAYESTVRLAPGSAGTWEAKWAPSVVEPSLRAGETLDLDEVAADRGDVLGRGGVRLVTERQVVRYGLDKTQVPPRAVAASARGIARALRVDVAPFVALARESGPEAFVEAIVLRAAEARRLVDPAYAEIPGAAAIPDTLPLAPTREFAAALLGRVGEATAEVIEESDGAVEAGDEVGLSGLQQRHDAQLRGVAGLVVQAVGSDGGERELFVIPPRDGRSLRTTLWMPAQLRAERLLARLPRTAGASALVAIEPSSGAVVAAANGPGAAGLNVATFGYYPPGSTFKVVSALALLRVGIGPGDRIDCPPTVTVDGRRFGNYDDYPAAALGRITLTQAIANSCNTAMIGSADRLGPGDLAAAAAALGFGVDHDVGFPALFGEVPVPESETIAAADLIGQGTVQASPLAMAVVAASVRAGRAVLPRLVPAYRVDQVAPGVPLTRVEARQLRRLMRAVVTSGSGSQLADLPGEVGAKTGTAEYGAPGPDGELPTHAWLIAARDDLAVAVFVENGASGAGTAGPIVEAFLRG